MPTQTDVLIIGGGLAGLTAALHLQKTGIAVILIEKDTYPHHKVCGEYVSNEILPYLQWLDADPAILRPSIITRLQFSTIQGNSIFTRLPLGGFGVSRYQLDNFLYEKFIAKGGLVIQDTVNHVIFGKESFTVSTKNKQQFIVRQVIGAYGKRSSLDLKLKRTFIQQKSPFLAVKAHYTGEFQNDLIALHNFKGGYCGVSKVEDQKINICYLADYNTFKTHKNIGIYQEKVLYQNKHLKDIFERCTPLFETPLTISQLSFGARKTVTDHILMIGDTAALIHPLCGNGMAMAIHSAQICATLLTAFFKGDISSRTELEKRYIISWNQNFKSRLRMGSTLSAILSKEYLAEKLISGMVNIPFVLPMLIKKTHGHLLTVQE
ncbi:flavin-dependent dehydrogenase [Pedobacter cryoconitis]|uniref:Flavin-dependent dehydrogenase n=1 Tax=Pedobacter cryoconitis TaxID=188932 RepID=A0A7W9DY04_9SPHI|nr:NAD(P)/FAD-dependent oxidoreductase [Pedobacter cryoconitis]MBB5634719.1 flavin-dependent dehydrogenase [Pedobacter cryoconitis]MBB6272150.1 flavin-dependent dehydrogenase [Pedobacter cryoconitis]